MATSFVYVVGPTSNPVKIGRAEDVATRLCQLQIGNADELILHRAIPMPRGVEYLVEAQVHDRLTDRRRRGEWFNIDAAEAIAVVSEIATRVTEEYYDSLDRSDLHADMWRRIRARHEIHADAQEAVSFYASERQVHRDTKAVKTMNGYIAQHAGTAGLLLMQRVLIADDLLVKHTGIDREARERGYELLAKAVNSLAEYYSHRKRVQAQRLWGSPKAVTPSIAEFKTIANAETSALLREETRRRKLAAQTAAIAKKPAA
jgi:hypothetical protein